MLRRPRNVVILVLVLLAGLHFLFFVSQQYKLTITTEGGKSSSSDTQRDGESFNEDLFSFPTAIIDREDEHSVKTLTEYDREVSSSQEGPSTASTEGDKEEQPTTNYNAIKFVRPPDEKVEEIFGDDIIKTENDKFIQKPFLKKGINPYDGREELLPKSNGIKKYASFGDPEKIYCDDSYCYVNERKIKKEIIKETPEDMFTFLPPEEEFMKEFRNPCWKARDLEGTEKLFCLPYFYIIGFTKCGTTDLFSILRNHTHVSSRAGKETHYFDRLRRGRIIRMNRKPSRLPVSFMSWTNAGKFRQNLISTYRHEEGSDVLFHGITMDATPSHVWDNEFWEVFHPGYREPPVTNADVIATIYPKSKIIVSMRNPISRMQSAYQFFCAFHVYPCDRPVTPEKFHNLVAEAVEMFRSCQRTNSDRGCVYSTESHQLATHLYASIYSVYLADWLKVFPRDQVYVMMFEEHIQDEVSSINNICDFLGISRFPVDFLQSYLKSHSVRNALKDSARIPYMLPETKQLLREFFKPFLDDLVGMLGDKKWYWNLY